MHAGVVARRHQARLSTVRDGNSEVYVMNADGSNPENLTNHPTTDFTPAWSPAGTKLAFATHRNAVGADVYVMDANGSNQENLTNGPEH